MLIKPSLLDELILITGLVLMLQRVPSLPLLLFLLAQLIRSWPSLRLLHVLSLPQLLFVLVLLMQFWPSLRQRDELSLLQP